MLLQPLTHTCSFIFPTLKGLDRGDRLDTFSFFQNLKQAHDQQDKGNASRADCGVTIVRLGDEPVAYKTASSA